jgi:hypothetical protein
MAIKTKIRAEIQFTANGAKWSANSVDKITNLMRTHQLVDANTVKVKILESVLTKLPPKPLNEDARRARWIGAWVRQAIESIPGEKHVDVFSTYYVYVGVRINNRHFTMEYRDGRLKYYTCRTARYMIPPQSLAAYIELADPDAAKQLRKAIMREL